jgi:hydroxymethylpyrimidine/phosphomethylpyrimidine kinase
VVTSLVAQNTQGVSRVLGVDAGFVREQITSVVDDIPLDATKIGMLDGAEIVHEVAGLIAARPEDFGPVIVDPVMVSTSGHRLISEEAAEILREELLPLAHVITPNLPEAADLLGEGAATSAEQMHDQALRLQQLGADVVLLKGGHLTEEEEVFDVLAHPGGVDVLRAPRVDTRNTHGTGCTLSSAIAAQYARIAGFDRADELDRIGEEGTADDDLTVIASAREFLQSALESGARWQLSKHPETAHGPVDHLITVER